MTNPPEAFLSYTRLDDEFFGGAITSFRRLLELGVQVVTGDRAFNVFQDIDGIEFGQKWQASLDHAISNSRFLIPIVTPLFFKSDPCRNELQQFIDHEKTLGRQDRILPIYFVTTPLLERPELLAKDPLATEVNTRQRVDWRVQADLAPNDPQIRRAVRELAEKIAAVVETTSPASAPVNSGRGPDPAAADVSQLVRNLGSGRESPKARKLVLWVDDRPDNNVIERQALSAYNMEFVPVKTTGEALAALRTQSFDAIISDMNRPQDSRAGYTLLDAVRGSGDRTPYFIYAGVQAAQHAGEARQRGAQGATNVGDELLKMMLHALDV